MKFVLKSEVSILSKSEVNRNFLVRGIFRSLSTSMKDLFTKIITVFLAGNYFAKVSSWSSKNGSDNSLIEAGSQEVPRLQTPGSNAYRFAQPALKLMIK